MDEQNNAAPAGPEQAPAVTERPAAPPPVRRGTGFWLKAMTLLYAASLIAAFALVGKNDAARKSVIKDLELAKLTGISKAKKDAVGVVEIYGAISQGSSSRSWERGSEQIAKRISSLAAEKDVKAIVLDINTPGGSVGAVQEIYSYIKRAKAGTKKPFIARFGEVSASGGYYVASACDQIYAQPGTITGSIGVIFSVGNFEGLMKKVGFKTEVIKSGKFKDIGSPTRDMTPEERRLLQGMIDDSYEQFVAAVAEGRKMPLEKVKELADGRIYTGRQALAVGLVDKLGDLQDALDAAGLMAGIGKNPRIVRDSAPLEQLFSLVDSRLRLPGLDAVAGAADAPSLEYRWYGR